MTIKEVVLPTERQRIIEFLGRFSLKYESNIDQTIYIEEGGEVVATVSASKYIIKCLAVNPDYRSENLAVALVSEMIKRFHANKIFHYQVFTKPEYRQVFSSLGFSLILETEKVVAMEGGDGDINSTIQQMLVQMKYNLGLVEVNDSSDIACMVINGNPFTNGHLKLAEYAAKKHKFLLVFVLEEEGSFFSFKERYALAYLALKPYSNILVLPSSEYMVSNATFPGYFLKSVDESTAEYAKYDATVFADYFIPRLGICKRYVGEETADYMRLYNDTLRQILKERVEVLPRFEEDGEVISAKKVRELIEAGKSEEALKLIPRNNYAVFKSIIMSKNV